jgi:TusA-related sulfurtransferase
VSSDSTAPSSSQPPTVQLDLRGTPCPLNFIRSKLALERIDPGSWLQVDLDAGEPEHLVASGLREAGHRVELEPLDSGAVRLLIQRFG